MEAAATVRMPLTLPSGDTVPVPLIVPNTPLTGASPHMLLLRSPTVDLEGSRVQSPASAASVSSACSAGPVVCTAMPCPSHHVGSDNQIVLLLEPYILRRDLSTEDCDRATRRLCALGAVPAPGTAVPSRVAGAAALAGPGRLGRPRAAEPPPPPRGRPAARRPGHSR